MSTISQSSLNTGNTTGLVLSLDATISSSYPGSGSTWTDLSSSGINASISGTPTYVNNGILFSGARTNYASLGAISSSSPISFTGVGFSVETTFMCLGFQATYYYGLSNQIIAKGPASTYNYAIEVYNDTTLSFIKRTGAEGLQFHQFTVPSLLGKIIHAVFVVSTTAVSLYINNTFISTIALGGSGGIAATASELVFIAGASDSQAFRGIIYAIKIYNIQLSTYEILQNYMYYKRVLGL